jgi:uncharacterized protein YhfF
MPVVGSHVMVTDGAGRPRCIWQSIEVTIKPFAEVDDAFRVGLNCLIGAGDDARESP